MREIHVSQISDYKTCPRMYKLRYIDNLVPITESSKLTLGTGVHIGLGAYYKTGDPELALEYFDVWAETEGVEKAEDIEEIRSLGKAMLEGYFEYAKKNDAFKVMAVEQSYRVPIWTTRGTVSKAYHKGTFDAIVVDYWGRWWIMEHKTASQFPSEAELRLDEQVGFYLLAATQMFDMKFEGVIYNVIRKIDPKRARTETVLRMTIPRNQHEIRNLRDRLYYSYRRIAEDKHFVPSPGKHCTWKCAYHELCVAMEDGSDYQLMMKLAYRKTDGEQSYGDRLERIGSIVEQRKVVSGEWLLASQL